MKKGDSYRCLFLFVLGLLLLLASVIFPILNTATYELLREFLPGFAVTLFGLILLRLSQMKKRAMNERE